jgi:hypothetical protein
VKSARSDLRDPLQVISPAARAFVPADAWRWGFSGGSPSERAIVVLAT